MSESSNISSKEQTTTAQAKYINYACIIIW